VVPTALCAQVVKDCPAATRGRTAPSAGRGSGLRGPQGRRGTSARRCSTRHDPLFLVAAREWDVAYTYGLTADQGVAMPLSVSRPLGPMIRQERGTRTRRTLPIEAPAVRARCERTLV
jgi:hypothetical protein